MWSDPIDGLIRMFEQLLELAVDGQGMQGGDPELYRSKLSEARTHRELEQKTGKVGFAATETTHG